MVQLGTAYVRSEGSSERVNVTPGCGGRGVRVGQTRVRHAPPPACAPFGDFGPPCKSIPHSYPQEGGVLVFSEWWEMGGVGL